MFAEVYERNNGNLAIYYGPEDHTGPVTRGGYHKFATPGYAGKALLQALDL